MGRKKVVLFLLIPWLASCTRANPPDREPTVTKSQGSQKAAITVRSSAFAEGQPIPKVYTCDGNDTSPPLAWSGVPDGTKSLALICEDPDAPRGTFTHWIVVGLPADVKQLAEGIAPSEKLDLGAGRSPARQGKNGFGKLGYGGPCPPGGIHHYHFRLFALDVDWRSGEIGTREQLLKSMAPHVLAEGTLIGTYSRE
jgi:Raf kinase inhibitor-like YbhB/YbcL family protein